MKCVLNIVFSLLLLSCTNQSAKDAKTNPAGGSLSKEYCQDSISCGKSEYENSLLCVDTNEDNDTKSHETKQRTDEQIVTDYIVNTFESDDKVDYKVLDKLVRDYISKKGMLLPSDKLKQIEKIDTICYENFALETDDGMMSYIFADTTELEFDMYINWLWRIEATRKQESCIDIPQEEQMFKNVVDAMRDCCDYIVHSFEGSIGWASRFNVHRIENCFKRSLYKTILDPQGCETLGFLLTPAHFSEECKIRYKHFKPDYDNYQTTPELAEACYDDYYEAMEKWLNYRAAVEQGITDSTLQVAYSAVTREYAKLQFIHLKTEFRYLGPMNDELEKRLLPFDCSDKQMQDYKLEVALKQK